MQIEYKSNIISFEIPKGYQLKYQEFRLPKKNEYFIGINKKGEFNTEVSYGRENNINCHKILGHLRPILIKINDNKLNYIVVNKHSFNCYKNLLNISGYVSNLVLCFDEDFIVGYSYLINNYLYIYVNKEYRRKKIGTHLIKLLNNKLIKCEYNAQDELYNFCQKLKIKLIYKSKLNSEELDNRFNIKINKETIEVEDNFYNRK